MLAGHKLPLVLYQNESVQSKPNAYSVVPKGVEPKMVFKSVDFTATNLA